MAEDFTAKFKVDISDLKKNITEANKQIKLANATFKSETAGMGQWSKDADGLSKKIEQLKTVLSSQKSVLSAYKTELDRTQKGYDENGKKAEQLKAKLAELAANGVAKTDAEYKKYQEALKTVLKEQDSNAKSCEELKLKILAQEGAVKETESSIGHYSDSLKNLEKESNSLSAAVDKQEKELADLKKEYIDVAASQGKDSDEAKVLAGEIDKLSSELKDNKSALSEAGKEADKLDNSFEDSGKSAKDAGDGFTVMKGVLSDLVASGIKLAIEGLKNLKDAAIEAWKEFDEGRDILVRLTGATGDESKKLQESYYNLSKKIVASSSDIGTALGEVKTRFNLSGKELEDLGLLYLQFAEITGSNVKSAIDDTQKALFAYGKGADYATNFLDVLAKTSQNTGVETSSLTSGLISNSTAFQELGLSLEQSVEFMGMLEKSGANSETVLNGMRKALKNSAKNGVDLNTALVDLQRSIEDNDDGISGLNKAYELFGKSGDQIYGAVKNGSINFENLTTAAQDSEGAVVNTFNETKDASDNFALSMQNLKVEAGKTFDKFIQEHGPELQALIQGFTDNVLPVLLKVLEKVFDIISKITSNSGTFKTVITAVGLLVAALATAKIITAAHTIWLAAHKIALHADAIASGVATAAQWALNAAMNAMPLMWIITLIGLLITGIMKLVSWLNDEEEAIDDVATSQQKLADAQKKTADASSDYIDAVDRVTQAYKDLKAAQDETYINGEEIYNLVEQGALDYADLSEEQRRVYKAYKEVIDAEGAAKTASRELEQAKKDETIAVMKNYIALADESGKYSELKDIIIDAYESGAISAEEARDLMELAMSGMSRYAQSTFLKDIPNAILEGIDPYKYETKKQGLVKFFGFTWDEIKAQFTDPKGYFSKRFGQAWEGIKEAFGGAGKWFENLWGDMKAPFAVTNTWFGDKFGSAWTSIKESFSGWDSFWGGLWDKVKNKFGEIGAKISDSMSSSVKSGMNGVISKIEGVINKAIGIINSAIGAVNKIPGVSVGTLGAVSLPRLARGGVLKKGQVGLLEGSGAEAVVPLDRNKKWIRSVAEDMIDALNIGSIAIRKNSNHASGASENFGNMIMRGLADGLSGKSKWLNKKAQRVVNSFKDVFTGKKGFDINSPSRWAEEIGNYIGTGLELGIKSSTEVVSDALTSLIAETQTSVQKVLEDQNATLLESERFYLSETERLSDSKEENDKKYLDKLKSKSEEQRKIYDAEVQDALNAKQKIIEIFNSMAQDAFKKITDLQNLQNDFAKKLDDSIKLFKTNTVSFGKVTETWYSIADLPKQTKQLEDFYDLLVRVKNRGNVPTEFFSMLRNMSIDEATKASKALLSLSDSEFSAYFDNWQHLREVETRIAKDVYADEAADLVSSINSQFDEIANNFLTIGENSADEFEDGFTAKLSAVLQTIRQMINDALGGVLNLQGTSLSIDAGALHSSASSMLDSVQPQTSSVASSVSNEKTMNFTQNIYAPQQPTRIELYRQTKNLLALAGRGI